MGSYDPAHLAQHAMEGLSASFAKEVRPGDIIVAGRNFGCGSSREQAVIALKSAGVSAVVAKSFARIFYRNAVNLGLHVLVSDDACDVFGGGDRARVDMDSLYVVSEDGTRKTRVDPVPGHVTAILRSGGLVPHLRARMGKS
ncbi:MAG: 3-isopropylmalate dehydratase small subunit [Thermoplasmata archaeon]|nr:3-isopropylmalate dehydratase small subunit [Thermoplasmata archaeon]